MVQGVVIDVKVGGKETCDCEATDPADRDTHIERGLAAAPLPSETQRVIVEVTPRLPLLMKQKNVDWSTDGLRQQLKGKWVEVTGWLLFDTAHITQAENTNPGHTGNWRATCWEVHPVTGITPLDAPPAAAANFSHTSLAAMQRLHAAHATREQRGKDAIAGGHKKLLSRFDKRELREAEEEAKERRK